MMASLTLMSNSTVLTGSNALSSRSDAIPVLPSLVPLFVRETIIGQYYQVSVVTVLAYDALITLDKESKYFWKAPRNSVAFVYFINRYGGLFGAIAGIPDFLFHVNATLCLFTKWAPDIANWFTVVLIDYILVIRVLALYSKDKRLAMCLYTLLVLEAIFKLGLFIFIDILEKPVVARLPKHATVCAVDGILPWQWGTADWTIPMVYGVILMVLALYKAAEYWRMSAGFKGFVLVKVLIQDQVLYFLLVVFCCMFNILQFRILLSNAFLAGALGSAGNPSFLSVLGSRLLFNLKEAAERGLNEGTNYRTSSSTLSEIDFSPPEENPEASQMEDIGDVEASAEHAI